MTFHSTWRGAFRGLAVVFAVFILLPTVLVPLRFRDQLETGHYFVFGGAILINFFLIGIFWYMSRSLAVRLEDGSLILNMMPRRVVPLMNIRQLKLDVVKVRHGSFLALFIEELTGDKAKAHIEYFENFPELLKLLKKKTGISYIMTDAAKARMEKLGIAV